MAREEAYLEKRLRLAAQFEDRVSVQEQEDKSVEKIV